MGHSGREFADPKSSLLASRPGFKPILLLIGAMVFSALVLVPPPRSMVDLAVEVHPSGYALSGGCDTITDSINKKFYPNDFEAVKASAGEQHSKSNLPISPEQAAQMAKVMLAIFGLAVFFWGTEALPLGATDILVGVLLYLFSILPVEQISQAYMKDAV